MSISIQLRKGLTRQYRLRDRNALVELLKQWSENVNVVGSEYVLTSQLYVDIEFNANKPMNEINDYSFIFVNNGTGRENDNFFAFIERVEPSEFRTEGDTLKSYFRIYFKVAWWETQLWWGNDLKGGIEGITLRSHVNDVEKRNDGTFEFTLDNALLNPEVPTTYYVKTSYDVVEPNLPPEISFLYIVSKGTNTPEERITNNIEEQTVNIGGRQFSTDFSVHVMPLYNGNLCDITVIDKASGKRTNCDLPYDLDISFDKISDSDIVSMYISRICCNYKSYQTPTQNNRKCARVFLEYEKLPISPSTGQINFYGSFYTCDTFDIYIPSYGKSITPLKLSLSNYGVTYNRNSVIVKPTNYDMYKANCIAKLHTFPYHFLRIAKDDENIIIDNLYNNGNIDILVYKGYYLIDSNSTKTIGRCEYSIISDYNIFQPTKVIDYYTRMQAKQNGINAISKLGMNVISMAGNAFAGNYVSATANLVGAMQGTYSLNNVFAQNEKLLRQGEQGSTLNPENFKNFYDSAITIDEYSLRIEQKYLVMDELARYGYFTNLHPHDILTNHKRKYFNYIQTQNATLLNPMLSDEVRNDITNMFDNGVFLFSEESMKSTTPFSLEVPNYCEIMDGGN